MTNYDFSKFSNQALEEIARGLLNTAFKLSLSPVSLKESKSIDLVELYNAESGATPGNVKAMAIVTKRKRPSEIIKEVSKVVQVFHPGRIFYLVFSPLPEIYNDKFSLELIGKAEFKDIELWDSTLISETLNKYPEVARKWGLINETENSQSSVVEKTVKTEKPIKSEDLGSKVMESSVDDEKPSESEFSFENKEEILFAKANGSIVEITTSDQKVYSIATTLKTLEKQLGGFSFCRVGRSYLVNLKHIENVEDNVIQIGGAAIPIGKSYVDRFYKQFDDNQSPDSIKKTNVNDKEEVLADTNQLKETESNYYLYCTKLEGRALNNYTPDFIDGRIKLGDILLVHNYGLDDSIKGLVLVEVVPNLPDSNSTITYQYNEVKEATGRLTLEEFEKVTGYLRDQFKKGSLLPINREIHDLLLAFPGTPTELEQEELTNTPYQPLKPFLHNDGMGELKDKLNIDHEVRSFAMLLASKDVNPPLAIALFGKWGSGKSFFMKYLAKKVNELTTYQRFLNHGEIVEDVSTEDVYCKGIAQIEFNAWSYLDANLWAGIAHSLFEKLNEYINGQTKSDLERLKIKVKLSKRLQLLHADLQNYQDRRASLQQLKVRLENEKEQKILKYFSSQYDQPVKDFLEKNGLEASITEQVLPSKLKKRVEKGVNLFRFWRLNPQEFFKLLFLWGVGLIAVQQLLVNLLPVLSQGIVWVKEWWVSASLLFIPFIKPVLSFWKSKQKTLAQLTGFIKDIRKLENEDGNEKDLTESEREIKEIDDLIAEVKTSIIATSSTGNDISQMAIANFLSSRHQQKDYTERLGIISIIRKDFETLSELFLQPEDGEEADSEMKQDRAVIQEQFQEGKPLKRIILYIDDLDRCSDEKVLEVIQAVHLLMAFPLFNVVVGVDKRCVYNALSHRNLLQYGQFRSLKEITEAGIYTVSPGEYLEKIFQIPYELKTLNEGQLKELTHSIMKDAVEVAEDREVIPDNDWEKDYRLSDEEMKVEKAKLKDANEDTEPYPFHPSERFLNEVQAEEEELSPVDLKISKEEFSYLKELVWLAGETPRTAKRFLNIYRLVRTHESWGQYSWPEESHEFLAVMFILAIGVGKYRAHAYLLFKELEELAVNNQEDLAKREKDNGRTLKVVFADLKKGEDKELNKVLKEITDYLSIAYKSTNNYEGDKSIKVLLNMTKGQFAQHLPFVRRFSFRLGEGGN